MHYTIVKGEGAGYMQSLDQLERAVNLKLKDGYKPIGEIQIRDFDSSFHGAPKKVYFSIQPMFKESD